MARYRRSLCWLRRDLRLSDHAALSEGTSSSESVALVFVFDTNILDVLVDRDDRRLSFIHDSLFALKGRLSELGSDLVVLHGDPVAEIPRLAESLNTEAVFTNRDYEPYAIRRDKAVRHNLQQAGRELHLFKDQVVFQGDELRTREGGPHRVYTPFMKCWRSTFQRARDAADHEPDLRHLIPAKELRDLSADWSLEHLGFTPAPLPLSGSEADANRRMQEFVSKLPEYAEARDFPALCGTSGLSPYLRFGQISIRSAVRSALDNGSPGAEKWLNELIWRDFYQAILSNFPYVVDAPFQEKYGDLQYPGLDEHFELWCIGQTGYPIVDAAMRCLNETGWMHNRLRMVVASFLTKDLLVDYRKGEAYFARKLLDFDLASNNGGWQWASSVGADPQPYFRVFNPILQSRKFDPDGAFIREWVPELADLDAINVHWPTDANEFELASAGVELGRTYPSPIVDHHRQKAIALELLETAKKS